MKESLFFTLIVSHFLKYCVRLARSRKEAVLWCSFLTFQYLILLFYAQLNILKMAWKKFMKSWLISQAQNAEIKMSTAIIIM